MSSLGKRRELDVMKLMMSDFTVEPINDRNDEFNVVLRGQRRPKMARRDENVVLLRERQNADCLIQKLSVDVVVAGPYESGVWKLYVKLPASYPYEPPRITFMNKILHPNICEISGSICLNVINKSWSPMYDLLNVFEIFLPQLLLYPNSSHGLNNDAISLLLSDKQQYEQKVKEYCDLYAKEKDVIGCCGADETHDEETSESEDASSDTESEDVASHVE